MAQLVPRPTRVPNLFVLGAGKCGTTSLHSVLGQHPEIHASAIKEPSYFCSYFQVVSDPEQYAALFESDATYRLDSSHVYMTNPETPQMLAECCPDALFIVSLRDPKARTYSLFRHMRRSLASDGEPYETIDRFGEALKSEDGRYSSSEFFANCRQYFWNFLYCRSSLYDVQLARYFESFARDRFFITTLAGLATDPVGLRAEILRFLDLDTAGATSVDFSIRERSPTSEPYDAECDSHMDAAFAGLTDRVDRLVGRALDWSL